MTRDELLSEVHNAWNPGDMIEKRPIRVADSNKWVIHIDADPIDVVFDLAEFDYRIKPKEYPFIVMMEKQSLKGDFEYLADVMQEIHDSDSHTFAFPPCLIEGIRNAKPLQDKE